MSIKLTFKQNYSSATINYLMALGNLISLILSFFIIKEKIQHLSH